MASAEYTPQPEQITPPDSVTPTRHAVQQHAHTAPLPSAPTMPDFTSPSAYINAEAYTPGDSYNPGEAYDPSSAASSMSMSHTSTMPDQFSFMYSDFTDYTGGDITDDRTPVVSDSQQPIDPRSFPAPSTHEDETVRAARERKQPPLLSPFRTGEVQQVPMAYPQQYAPAPMAQVMHAGYYPPPQEVPPQPLVYNPQVMAYQTYAMPQGVYQPVGPYYPAPSQHLMMPAQSYDFGPPRSRNGSPTSSISSSAVSLSRTHSTSSDLRQPRPKVKLTWEDKRNIVELHRSNSSLRQEDIARQYGVDRSTISKIILSAHRWTQPQEIQLPIIPKAAKQVGGRFPAIEAKMDLWMDEQIAMGQDIRDNMARDKAKDIAREIGFPIDRFKASAKWYDKFKERRKLAGKPNSSPSVSYYMPYTHMPHPDMFQTAHSLSRSQSTVTLSSSDSSGQDMYQPSPGQHSILVPTPEVVTPHHMPLTRSETDLAQIETTPSSRQRSQSSPHLLVTDAGMISPSSGKATRFPRAAPLQLQRQNSYHGSSPSPRRPVQLTRSNTSQGGIARRSRPTSLAASAFGITPIVGGEDSLGSGSPAASPISASTSGTHSRQHSEVSLAPFTTSMGGMTISPTISDTGEMISVSVPPMTPNTPGQHLVQGVFAGAEYVDMASEFGAAPMGHQAQPGQYATMPNKHYGAVRYPPPYTQQPLPQQVQPSSAWQ